MDEDTYGVELVNEKHDVGFNAKLVSWHPLSVTVQLLDGSIRDYSMAHRWETTKGLDHLALVLSYRSRAELARLTNLPYMSA